ncbi:MAG: DUF4783 domain-containing protein [Haliscomenobacteraceae bacterium CHB4]|nr:hypothetical protein [Saprospiraceae bacterium]MCE7922325.1 DUF4783 domain-containing protein [Haliscomenobacteraceae bacterium CHB4]
MRNLFFLLLFAPAIAFSQSGTSLESITSALNAGDADALSKYFASNVEISIEDNEQVYAKAKATEVVRNFFNTNKPKSFSQMHKGVSRENSDQYSIGNLSSVNGNYRVYLYLKVSGSNLSIQEMRFDKE